MVDKLANIKEVVPAGIDEFTHLFGQDDIRLNSLPVDGLLSLVRYLIRLKQPLNFIFKISDAKFY